jgi:endoglucanase
LSFHFYYPLVFTHYKASWTKVGEYTGPVKYPGQIIESKDLVGLPQDLLDAIAQSNGTYDRQAFSVIISKPLAKAKETGLPLYCGEWGCLSTVPTKDRIQWYKDVRSVFDENNIAWATWEYKEDFGIRDASGKPVQELVDVLLSDQK